MDKEESKEFALDESAQQLYQKLEGIDQTKRVSLNLQLESELMQFLQEEEKARDTYRLLIAQAVCHFVDILAEGKSGDFGKGDQPKLRALLNVLKKIAELSGRDRKISCRFRGQQTISESGDLSGSSPEAYDYELSIGDILLDYLVARKVEEREAGRGKSLCANLLRAFKILSNLRIFNFAIYVKAGDPEEYSRYFEVSLRSLVRFYNPKEHEDHFLVRDEYGKPNIDLTLLAATNNVRPDSLQNLVDKISPRLQGPDPASELNRFTTVYDVVRATKRFQPLLKHMPIEVNNAHQLMLNSRSSVRQTLEAVQVSRLVLAQYGDDPIRVSELISSISKDGYRNIQSRVMGKRLSIATEFLELAEGSDNREALHHEALQNIEHGLENIPDEMYDGLSIEDNQLSAVDDQGEKTSWPLHRKIFHLVSYFKQRALTKIKVRDLNKKEVKFDAADYSVIATNCKVTEGEAEHLVALLKGCFSEFGRFRRVYFEKNIPEFLRYEENIFEFLWFYLKELPTKEDRIALLNSTLLLVGQLQKPEKVLSILLTDIFNPTSLMRYSDRNGLILTIVLLRTYHKEAGSNIELTPEEVLFALGGLNQQMVEAGLEFFRHNHEQIVVKVKRLTELLLQVTMKKAPQEEQMPLRFLIYLMRELVIFCALIGGRLSQSTVRGVVREFGNPHSPFYRKVADKSHISRGLKLLQVAARGLKRFADPEAAELLKSITDLEPEFIQLYDNPNHRVIVTQIMEQVGRAEV